MTILAWVYIAVGAGGVVSGLPAFGATGGFSFDNVLVELVRLLAVVCGAFMLSGHNWARWLALAWIVFHVAVSAFHALSEFAIHCLFCAVIAWLLFRPPAKRYFQSAKTEP